MGVCRADGKMHEKNGERECGWNKGRGRKRENEVLK